MDKCFWQPTETFANSTTIHGTKFFGGSNRHFPSRVVFGIILLGCIGASIYFVQDNIVTYLQYNLKTTVEYFKVGSEGFNFPAVTFCNHNYFNRSVVAPFFYLYAFSFMDCGYVPPNEVGLVMSTKICGVESESGVDYEQIKQEKIASMGVCSEPVVNGGIEALDSLTLCAGVSGATHNMLYDSVNTVKRCQWNGKDLPCDSIFLNHMTDAGSCFTFNPAVSVISSYKTTKEPPLPNGLNRNQTAFGMTVNDSRKFIVRTGGHREGLQLIMNVGSDEYCDFREQMSVGIRFIVHEPDDQPLLMLNRMIDIQPGAAIDASIKIRETVRHTEDMGLCRSQYKYKYFRNRPGYSQEACDLECLTSAINDTLGCIIYYAPPDTFYLQDNFRSCFFNNTMPKVMAVEAEFIQVGYAKKCPQCIPACHEMKFDVSTSQSAFPTENAFAQLKSSGVVPENMSFEKFRRNYLLLNLHLADMDYPVLVESREMSPVELTNALGGAISLFLGASLISCVEVVIWLVTQFIIAPCRRCH